MPWGLPWWSNDEESACQHRRRQSQVWEDSTWHEATKPVHHSYCSPGTMEPVLHSKRSHCNEKPEHNDKDPVQPKKKKSHGLSQRWPQIAGISLWHCSLASYYSKLSWKEGHHPKQMGVSPGKRMSPDDGGWLNRNLLTFHCIGLEGNKNKQNKSTYKITM